ncbi:hypothetical protein ACFFWB_22095 [Flavobacterium procerum]|uniref:hypothetical protein n=1 Tax=Flavobacterium procerum TaxID=1455569 RepID=UPI0035ED5ACB
MKKKLIGKAVSFCPWVSQEKMVSKTREKVIFLSSVFPFFFEEVKNSKKRNVTFVLNPAKKERNFKFSPDGKRFFPLRVSLMEEHF